MELFVGKEPRLQLPNIIKIRTERLTFLRVANNRWGEHQKVKFIKFLLSKLLPSTEDVPSHRNT